MLSKRPSTVVRDDIDMEVKRSVLSMLLASTTVCFTFIAFPEKLSSSLLALVLSVLLSVLCCCWRSWWNVAQASLLGGLFMLSLLCAFFTTSIIISIFAQYAACIAFFHYSEFFTTAFTNRADLSVSSYLLDHSVAYWMAAVTSWIEFALEARFAPILKNRPVSLIGLLLVICGEIMRKLAMVHAKGNFTHMVASSKRPEHILVTDGVYAFVRHPGYLGWLVWCIGTQVVLCNPVCLIVYAIVGWNFFKNRIEWEELCLRRFFGQAYCSYQERVPTGIPYIKGFTSKS